MQPLGALEDLEKDPGESAALVHPRRAAVGENHERRTIMSDIIDQHEKRNQHRSAAESIDTLRAAYEAQTRRIHAAEDEADQYRRERDEAQVRALLIQVHHLKGVVATLRGGPAGLAASMVIVAFCTISHGIVEDNKWPYN